MAPFMNQSQTHFTVLTLWALVLVSTIVSPNYSLASAEDPSSEQYNSQDKIQVTTKTMGNSIYSGEALKYAPASSGTGYNSEKQPWTTMAGALSDDEFSSGTIDTLDDTKTYERVVLEGSRISISCPHLTIIVPTGPVEPQEPEEGAERGKPFAASGDGGDPHSMGAWDSSSLLLDKQKQFATSGPISELLNNHHHNNKLEELQLQTKGPTVSQGEFEQVKWFRNHVPLVDLNHFRHLRRQKAPTDPKRDNAANMATPEETLALETLPIWTTELSRPTKQATPIRRRKATEEQRIRQATMDASSAGDREQKLANQSQRDTDSLEAGGTTGNVNELVGNRKSANNMATSSRATPQLSSEEPRWYVNQFGELVINEVSLYFAGKYTCLAAGQQSEVLLDVLTSTEIGPHSSQLLAAKAAPFEKLHPNGSGGARKLSDAGETTRGEVSKIASKFGEASGFAQGGYIVDGGETSGDLVPFQVETGNGHPIEKEMEASSSSSVREQSFHLASLPPSANSKPTTTIAADTNGIIASSQPGDYQLFTETANEERHWLGIKKDKMDSISPIEGDYNNNSSPANNNSINLETFGADNSTNLPSDNKRKSENSDDMKAKEQQQLKILPLVSSSSSIDFINSGHLNSEQKPGERKRFKLDNPIGSPWPNVGRLAMERYVPMVQAKGVHLVRVEAIQMNDLKMVPGFLYTKQQLYCPISGLAHSDHIRVIMRKLCDTNSPAASRKPDISSHFKLLDTAKSAKRLNGIDLESATKDEDEQMLRCLGKVETLIGRLVVDGTRDCDGEGCSECHNEPILNLVWIKDGARLEFDTSGRATSTRLNLKLLNAPFSDGCQSRDTATDKSPTGSPSRGCPSEDCDMGNGNRVGQFRGNDKFTCGPLPAGRILEIDGIRRESGGHYTCALELSVPKLERMLLENMVRSRNSKGPSYPKNNLRQNYHDDALWSTQNITMPEPARYRGQQKHEQLFGPQQIDNIKTTTSANGEPYYYGSAEAEATNGKEPKGSRREPDAAAKGEREMGGQFEWSLAQRIALLDSILNGSISSDDSQTYLGRLFSRLSSPLKTIQSFSVVVAERAANSCDLWSTILEAGNAYTRRKLADFKRLKRSNSLDLSFLRPASSNGLRMRPSTRYKSVRFPIGAQYLGENRPQQAKTKTHPPIGSKSTGANQLEEQLNANKRNSRGNDNEEDIGQTSELGHSINSDNSADNDEDGNVDQNHRAHGGDSNVADGRKQEVEEPLDGWRSISGSGDGGSTESTSIGGQQNKHNEQTGTLLNNSADSLDATINTNSATSGAGQTAIHTVEVGTFNYNNERISKPPLYASTYTTATTTTNAHGAAPIAATSSAVLRNLVRPSYYYYSGGDSLVRNKRSQMIRGNHDFDDETVDLIMQRGHNQGINSWSGHRTNSEPPPNGEDWRHPTVMDGTSKGSLGSLAQGFAIINRQADGDESRGQDFGAHRRVDQLAFEAGGEKAAISMRKIDDGVIRGTRIGPLDLADSSWGDKSLGDANVAADRTIENGARRNSGSNSMRSQSRSQANTQSSYPEPRDNISEPHEENVQTLSTVIGYREANRQSSDTTSSNESSATKSDPEWGFRLGGRMENSFTKPMAYEDGFDESLMWSAGQYLYMHMRALASSSLFGVEVAVEWSNERSNGTGADFGPADGRKVMEHEMIQMDSIGGQPLDSGSYPPNGRIRDAVPFATIDVIAGQNLQLQCTAQALGRLPEVKWYKRINSIPSKLKSLIKVARKIGHDFYWPLTELDILNECETPEREKSFVCSQTTAIFDNLANQTFTVISSLKLSQYNDFVQPEAIKSNPLPVGSVGGDSYNLYACIVDADVRHKYATLGVHFREAPSKKISFEISKRLGARFALANKKPPKETQLSRSRGANNLPMRVDGVPMENPEKYANYDLYRENQLQFSLKPSYWIPIQNGSSYVIDTPLDGYPLTPAMLSTVIVFVFSSLLALMYLTLRTYRNLTLNQFEEELINQLDDRIEGTEQQGTDVALGAELMREQHHLGSIINSPGSRCACHQFDHDQTSATQQRQQQGSPETTLVFEKYLDTYATQLGLANDADFKSKSKLNQRLYYQAHAHTIEPHQCPTCSRAEEPIMTAIPSERNKSNYSYTNYNNKGFRQQQQILTDCCQQSTIISMVPCQTNDRFKVNLVENPLNETSGGQYSTNK